MFGQAKVPLVFLILLFLGILPGCLGDSAAAAKNQSVVATASQPGSFITLQKDGIQIACPADWQSQPIPNAVFSISQGEHMRITTAVLPALPLSYYEGLADQGTVNRTVVSGYLAYRSTYVYSYNGIELETECVSLLEGDKACHIMSVCATQDMASFEPVFDRVLNSVKFLEPK